MLLLVSLCRRIDRYCPQAVYFFLVGQTNAAVAMCFFYRHQAVLPPDSWMKLGTVFCGYTIWLESRVQRAAGLLYSALSLHFGATVLIQLPALDEARRGPASVRAVCLAFGTLRRVPNSSQRYPSMPWLHEAGFG